VCVCGGGERENGGGASSIACLTSGSVAWAAKSSTRKLTAACLSFRDASSFCSSDTTSRTVRDSATTIWRV